MGIAANAVADLVGPPPPRAATADDRRDGPSFQDHVDVADRSRDAQAQARDAQARDDARSQAAQSQSSDQSNDPSKSQSSNQSDEAAAPAQPRLAEEKHADTKPDLVNPPIFLQLIANAIAPIIGVKAAQIAPLQQENPQATPAEQAAAQASSGQAISAQAAALANTAPVKVAPKADGGARPGPAKTAKGATEKTEAASATLAAIAAPEVTDVQVETGAPAVLAANLAAQNDVTSRGGEKSTTAAKTASGSPSGAVEGVQAAPPRAGHAQAPPQAAASAQPPLAPETPLANSPEAKPRDEGKAFPLAEALKQANQDFATAAPKAQPSPSTQPAAMSAHPQLATPTEQAPISAARAQAPPVALQVGGEIIRRFNGADTSFQLRLDPPDLGRVDVRLDVSRDHRVTAVFSADSPQALSDLARGARDLQQALQSAGLDLADDGLRFDLSSNGQGNAFAQAQAQQDQQGIRAAGAAQAETSIAPEITALRPLSIDSWRGARVDLMA